MEKKESNVGLIVMRDQQELHEDTYDIFVKAQVELPDTCIEAAEHALKCMKQNRPETARIGDGNTAFPAVYMQFGAGKGLKKFDIDKEHMDEKSAEVFRRSPNATDATSEIIDVGEGLALVFSESKLEEGKWKVTRQQDEWTVHAVAVVLKGNLNGFMIVVEKFANDRKIGPPVMVKAWKLAAYRDADEFAEAYKHKMPRPKYKLWKLTAQERGAATTPNKRHGSGNDGSTPKKPRYTHGRR